MADKRMNFWERWLAGFIVMIPVTAITSCVIAFMVMDRPFAGLTVWFGEAALFGLGIATCPEAELFQKPWWDRSELAAPTEPKEK
jgi:uncharacterized membrane protein YhaH (DUF805 family)